MSFDRRTFLGWSGAAALGTMIPAAAQARAPTRPRAIVQIILSGGTDAILTSDPKAGEEIAAGIDRPYDDGAILRAGDLALGPLFHPLASYRDRMAILNGVLVSTAAHHTGTSRLATMRRSAGESSPELTQLIGESLAPEAPLACVRFANYMGLVAWSQGRVLQVATAESRGTDESAIREPAKGASSSPYSSLDVLARSTRDRAARSSLVRRLRAQASRSNAVDAAEYTALAALLERWDPTLLPEPTMLAEPKWDNDVLQPVAPQRLRRWSVLLRDTLFLLEHQLTPAVLIDDGCKGMRDSHTWNLPRQNVCGQLFMAAFVPFMKELERRRTPDGVRLSDQVLVVVSSEMGRFPIKNAVEGKDHLPEVPMLFFGPGVRPGQYGATNDRMLAQPISRRTGRPSHDSTDLVPGLEDVGATLLALCGVPSSTRLGFPARPLDFLLA